MIVSVCLFMCIHVHVCMPVYACAMSACIYVYVCVHVGERVRVNLVFYWSA